MCIRDRVSAGIFYKKINDFIVDQVIGDYTYQNNEYKKFTLSLIHISKEPGTPPEQTGRILQ